MVKLALLMMPAFGTPHVRRGAIARRTCLAPLTLLAVLILPSNCFAGKPWDKTPEQWTLAEVQQILTDSPWSPAKTRIGLDLVKRRYDPVTRLPSDSPVAPREPGWIVRADLGRKGPPPAVSVLWWSSKTLRLAQQRLRQLRDPSIPRVPLRAEALDDFVLVVEGAEALRILRDAAENLREVVYLELAGGMSLDVAEIRFVEGEGAGQDFVAFHFPRQIDGNPTLDPAAGPVVFHCKATAKTALPGRPHSLSIRTVFQPRQMRVSGLPDL